MPMVKGAGKNDPPQKEKLSC